MYRGFLAAMGAFFGRLRFWDTSKVYADPHLNDPYHHSRSRLGTKVNRRGKTRTAIPCVPGTITYHDKLVKHFGRRRAEGYRVAIQRGHLNCLPTEKDFRNNPPWGFVKPQV